MPETTPEKDNPGVIALPPLIYAGPMLLALLFNRLFPAKLLPPKIAKPLGWTLLGLTTFSETWFFWTMKRNGTNIDPGKPVTTVIDSGPFRFSRNPSYVSFTAIYIGIASLVNTPWPLFLLPGILGVMQKGVIEREERYLERKFGEDYLRYKKRVRRWL